MPASFLHGIEVIEVGTGPLPVTVVKSAVVGMVGTAPLWAVQSPSVAPAVNLPTLVSSAQRRGEVRAGRAWILDTLCARRDSEPGRGPGDRCQRIRSGGHFTSVAATPFTFNAQGVINLGHMGVSNVVVTSDPVGTTYVAGTDYTLDPVNGVVTIIPTTSGGHIAAGATMFVAFNYADPTKVQDSAIIGAFTSGVYTGIQALQTTYGTMGFFSKILIAPGYSQSADVAAALTHDGEYASCSHFDGFASFDPGSERDQQSRAGRQRLQHFEQARDPLLSARNLLSIPESFLLASPSARLELRSSSQANALAVGPYSAWVAGAMAAQDLANGYWWSPSNVEIERHSGTRRAALRVGDRCSFRREQSELERHRDRLQCVRNRFASMGKSFLRLSELAPRPTTSSA